MVIKINVRRLLLILSFVVTQQVAKAQDNNKGGDGTIKGRIIDSAFKTPIDYATITLYALANNKAITGTTTDSSGTFILGGILPGTYTLSFEFIGYAARSINGVVISKKNAFVTDPIAPLRTGVLAKYGECFDLTALYSPSIQFAKTIYTRVLSWENFLREKNLFDAPYNNANGATGLTNRQALNILLYGEDVEAYKKLAWQ